MKKFLLSILALATILLTACSNTSPTSNEKKGKVITSFYPVYEFTKQVAGDELDVELLINAGTEVHDFSPSTKDIAKITEADMFVYLDDNMETWAENVIATSKKSEESVIMASDGILLLPGLEEEHDHHGHDHHGHEGHHHEFDPHLWLSPERAITLLENIKLGLIAKYPNKKEIFEKNANNYLEKLTALDKAYREKLSNAKQKHFVTQHTAFAYLAFDYGLKQVAISGLNAEADPSIQKLQELTQYIKDNDIKYIYFEENAKKSLAETLAKETGVLLEVLNPLESLSEDNIKNGKDYISVMTDNLNNLYKTTSQEGKPLAVEEKPKTVYNGYFEDKDVKDRTLSDYAGQWQSVYPYLLDGTFDQVFDFKAKKDGSMTKDEYKKYYDKGYKTNVDKININSDNTMEFIVNGEVKKFTYEYVGKEVLTYKRGNRGVRYLFTAKEENAGEFKHIQFSDHNIAPVKTGHFHIFYGQAPHEKLLEEMENWPTYYPTSLTAFDIAQEMIAH